MTATIPTRCAPRAFGHAFTLVEILIVVVILGVLAAIVIPQFTSAAEDSRKTVFATNLREFVKGIRLYNLETDLLVADGGSGLVPPGLDPYVDVNKWLAGTPIGGVWDAESNDLGGFPQAVGVHFNGIGMTRDDAFMTEIDAILDDGDLTTGVFRKIAGDRYYFIIDE